MGILFKSIVGVLSLSFVFSVQSRIAYACTTFAMPEKYGRIVAENFDWHVGYGLVVVNKRDVKKQSLTLSDSAPSIQWTSKLGSITFNQVALDHPMSGMNEAGLVVAVMENDGEGKLSLGEKPAINELQWVQYQLDQYASTQEVLDQLNDLAVFHVLSELHYLVCDGGGRCAAIEVDEAGQKLKSYSADAMPVRVLANDPYRQSLKHYQEQQIERKNYGADSLERFMTAAAEVLFLGQGSGAVPSAEAESFRILSETNQGDFTKWQIVYDQGNGEISYRPMGGDTINSVKFKDLDFTSDRSPLIKEIDQADQGGFRPFSHEDGERMVEESFYLDLALGKTELQRIRDYPAKP